MSFCRDFAHVALVDIGRATDTECGWCAHETMYYNNSTCKGISTRGGRAKILTAYLYGLKEDPETVDKLSQQFINLDK